MFQSQGISGPYLVLHLLGVPHAVLVDNIVYYILWFYMGKYIKKA